MNELLYPNPVCSHTNATITTTATTTTTSYSHSPAISLVHVSCGAHPSCV